ncbi:MAG: hypothetical protein HQK53_02990 [Oligoflexia bacterium]|nr:hypothetical protein [Oligoflexia bacterium]
MKIIVSASEEFASYHCAALITCRTLIRPCPTKIIPCGSLIIPCTSQCPCNCLR